MSPAVVAARRPVWLALSELYLDQDLTAADLDYVARALRQTGLGWPEIARINAEEVAPVLLANLRSPAGQWAGFDADWLVARITARRRRRFRLPGARQLWGRYVRWMLRDCWPQLAQRLSENGSGEF